MIVNVNAGHGKQDSKSQGASSVLLKESVDDRIVKDEVIRLLNANGVTTYDTTVDYPSGSNAQRDCLNKIIALCNQHKTDLDISIHFNSGANDINGDGKTTGTECWIYPGSGSRVYAQRIVSNMASLGFKNRGVKTSKDFAVLKTHNPCIIIEVCFVDDKDDIKIYNPKVIAKAIVEGILNKSLEVKEDKTKVYIIETGGFGTKEAAELNASYLKGLTGWNIDIKGSDYHIEVNGFLDENKANAKLNSLKELTGWWATVKVI